MIALALAGALTFGGGCVDALCNSEALAPYFTKLQRARGGAPVHILQIGDSHTAGDAITGAWRDILQARYGSAGRGVLPPGRPYDGYTTRGVSVTMSSGWSIASDFGPTYRSPSPPLGVSSYSLTSQSDGASMSLVADGGEAFTRMTVCAIAKPGAGSLTLRAGVVSDTFDLGSSTERPECRTLRSDAPVTDAGITASGGVTVTSWATFADSGVVLSNVGVVGSQLVHFARTDDAVLTEELRAYRPDLIVLAFGTNEGFAGRFASFEYEIILRTQIGRLRRLAGNVPILLLGAPDALSRQSALRANTGGEPAAACGEMPAPVAAPPPAATGALADLIGRLREGLGLAPSLPEHPDAPPADLVTQPPSAGRGPLFPPPALDAVRDVQRRVARSLNIAFWDWEAREGGRCTALAWVRANPPLMRGDYVHYTSTGGRELAQRLQADLDAAASRAAR